MSEERPRARSPRPLPGAVFLAGSAGAPEVVAVLLAGLPADFPVPLVVLIHLPRQRPSALARVLAARCRLPVREPQDREPLAAGSVFVAPPDYHLLVDPGPVFALSIDAPVHFSIPSIDVLLESAADVLGPRAAAILLSGANADGARGLAAVLEAGGQAIVQAPDEATQPAMPRAALAMSPRARVFRVEGILRWLQELTSPVEGRGTS